MDATGLPSGTVYPMLRRLEKEGLVRAAWEDPEVARTEQRPPRRYYELTGEGETLLAAAKARYRMPRDIPRARGFQAPPLRIMTRRSPDPLPCLCLLVVRVASRIVPRADRGPWRREWDAELRHRWSPTGGYPRREMHMVRRSFGSLVDAAWLRRQLTLDADVVHDAAHGVRLLAKSPGFTAVALLVLATGLGASTVIVSLTDALLFRRLPIPDADRVVTLWERNRATGVGREDVAPGNAIDWVTKPASFAAAAAVEPWSLDFTAPGGEPEVLAAVRVSPKFFDVIGVPMLHGRAFLPGGVHQGERQGRDPFVRRLEGTIQRGSGGCRPRDPVRSRAVRSRRSYTGWDQPAVVRSAEGAARLPYEVLRRLRAEDPRQQLLERAGASQA